ncbi:MAG: KamA family radical SAM protein [Chitinispirillaceae bacterium]|nr:KamA family radical SAM protein [Chitinispirillaceae bacterium]
MRQCAGQTSPASAEQECASSLHYRLPSKSLTAWSAGGSRKSVQTTAPVSVAPDRICRLSGGTLQFRKKFYPDVTKAQWDNWRWQVTHRVDTVDQLEKMLSLSPEERKALYRKGTILPFAITPYYASLLDSGEPRHPLRRTVIPVDDEFTLSTGESDDPLCEDSMSPVPGIIHRYPDRVLFLVTTWCSTYCRYCTRSRMVGNHAIQLHSYRKRMLRALSYIASNPSIRDVLLSGGDPLTLDDMRIEWILGELRKIPHVEIIRIGTKAPVVLPQRITGKLISMLKRYHPLWMSIHFTHPYEITPEVRRACTMLADAGIPLGSQTVLLSGINDDTATLRALYHSLMKIRVKPYYLYQCDPITGSAHFRTPVAKGIEIISDLQGNTSGYAVPRYVIDAPGGGGKIPIEPNRQYGRKKSELILVNYEGKLFVYPDTAPGSGVSRLETGK